MKSILDRSFNYTPAAETNLKKTFARVRKEQAAQKPTTTPGYIWIDLPKLIIDRRKAR